MRYSKVLKLGAVGLTLLLIPRRSSRQSQRQATDGLKGKAVSQQQSEHQLNEDNKA